MSLRCVVVLAPALRLGQRVDRDAETVSLRSALTGFKLTLPQLDGREVSLPIRDVVQPNSERRIRGEGMPNPKNPSTRGDMRVRFNVEFPRTISDDAKHRLKEVL